MYRSTRQVAKLLDVTPSRLSKAVWDGRLSEPERGPSGAFLWSDSDAQRACWTLLRCDLDTHLASKQERGQS
jgi:hypothetical protein